MRNQIRCGQSFQKKNRIPTIHKPKGYPCFGLEILNNAGKQINLQEAWLNHQ